MTRVNLLKLPYVEREPRRDFSDDGNRFKVYLYKGKLPFTYCTIPGMIFLCVRFDMAGMNYEVYKNNKERGDWNGIDREDWDPEKFLETLESCYNFMMTH